MTVHNWALNEQLEKEYQYYFFSLTGQMEKNYFENMRYKTNILLLNTELSLPGNFHALCHTHTHRGDRKRNETFVCYLPILFTTSNNHIPRLESLEEGVIIYWLDT
jgi:hypothetical protein